MLYLTEGDYINAGLSALGIIPGADAFTKTGKASKVLGNGIVESGLKHLDNVADGIRKLVKKADDAIDLEKHLPKKLLTEEAETFAKKADKVADDVVEDAAKAIKSGRASELPTIEKGTKEWDEAVKSIANGGNTSYRTKTATEAKELLNEARGNMNRYKQYTSKQYKKGYEMHPNEINTRNAPHNDLPHVKWKDWLDELHSGKGHIFFDKPN